MRELARVLGVMLGVVMVVGGGSCFIMDGFFTMIAFGSPHSGGGNWGSWWSMALLALVAFAVAYAGFVLVRRCIRMRRAP